MKVTVYERLPVFENPAAAVMRNLKEPDAVGVPESVAEVVGVVGVRERPGGKAVEV